MAKLPRTPNQRANLILERAQELLAGPKKDGGGWIKGASASTGKNGITWGIDVGSPNAKCFCASGAIRRAAIDLKLNSTEASARARNKLASVMNNNIESTNDHYSTTFPQVMMAFDLARTLRSPL